MQIEQIAVFNSPRSVEFARAQLSTVKSAVTAYKGSLEKGCTGDFNKQLTVSLENAGWRARVPIDIDSHAYITALNDGESALQLQTGNAARAFYDLMKIESAYRRGLSRLGFLIVPSTLAASRLSANVANFDRINDELSNLFSAQFMSPLYLISIQ